MHFFSGTHTNQRFGNLGEETAAIFLKKKGMRILERNWRYRQWELDLICLDRKTLVFVEVKTRSSQTMGTPADALTYKKQARLIKAASYYLSKKDLWDTSCRFDFVAVIQKKTSLEIEHTENAFDLTDHTNGW